MKKLLLITLLFSFMAGCSDELKMETKESINESVEKSGFLFDFNLLSTKDYDDLLLFFNVQNANYLIAEKVYSKSNNTFVIVIVEEEFIGRIELADKAVYIQETYEFPEIVYFLSKNEQPNGIGNIDIFEKGDIVNSLFNISFNKNTKQTSLIINRSFNDCVHNCVHNELSDIFENGSWVQQAAFIINAPSSFAVIVAHCFADCS